MTTPSTARSTVRLGLGWAKSHSFYTGQCPALKYNRGLMMSILHDKAHIADAVNATVIGLEDAPQGYAAFDSGWPRSSCWIRTGWSRPSCLGRGLRSRGRSRRAGCSPPAQTSLPTVSGRRNFAGS